MIKTEKIMGMPVTIEISGKNADQDVFSGAFDYFRWADRVFSPYKKNSEVSLLNAKSQSRLLNLWNEFRVSGNYEISADEKLFTYFLSKYKITTSEAMNEILRLSLQTAYQTDFSFNVFSVGRFDPSGLVKGWAIRKVYELIRYKYGLENFYINAGGDLQTSGTKPDGSPWSIGIRHPFLYEKIVKVIYLENESAATSGSYFRGNHIYRAKKSNLVSLTVVGDSIFDSDRFATAAFAMGDAGIGFIQNLKGFEGYAVYSDNTVQKTGEFDKYCHSDD